MMRYNYFIYYTYANGHGNVGITRCKPINSFDDIPEIEKFIQKKIIDRDSSMQGKAVISNYIELSREEIK